MSSYNQMIVVTVRSYDTNGGGRSTPEMRLCKHNGTKHFKKYSSFKISSMIEFAEKSRRKNSAKPQPNCIRCILSISNTGFLFVLRYAVRSQNDCEGGEW